MSQEIEFQKRIEFEGDIVPVLKQVCTDFNIGDYCSHSVAPIGYEDFNLILQVKNGKYFVKIFANFRSDKDCQRYIDVATRVMEAGVNHPKLFSSNKGSLYQTKIKDTALRLCVMEFIDGKTFHDLGRMPTIEEIKGIIDQAVKINSLNYEPYFLDDSWDISNFSKEYATVGKYLSVDDKKLLVPLNEDFERLDTASLPHALVHGDLISTNILRSKKGKIYFIDFSVANFYPRVQELAILLCDVLFDRRNLDNNVSIYEMVVDEYQKHILLTNKEIEILPTYLKLAHAMHIVGATREKYVNGNESEENDYWLNLGRTGLKFMTDGS